MRRLRMLRQVRMTLPEGSHERAQLRRPRSSTIPNDDASTGIALRAFQDRRAGRPSRRGRRRSCAARRSRPPRATLGVEAHADHAFVLERLRPRSERRAEAGPAFRTSARASVATMPDPAAPGTTTRGSSPGSSISSSDCWALRCSPPKTRIRDPGSIRDTDDSDVVRSPGGSPVLLRSHSRAAGPSDPLGTSFSSSGMAHPSVRASSKRTHGRSLWQIAGFWRRKG